MAFSTSLDFNSLFPSLTSDKCTRALSELFHNEAALAIATEASSHPSGILSLWNQPYVYAGGGLGNIDECRYYHSGPGLTSCLAGGARRDSITFASVCVPLDCTALDLMSDDFVATLQLVSEFSIASDPTAVEYVRLNANVKELNTFLNTGWTCGEYVVPWHWWESGVYLAVTGALVVLTLLGTFRRTRPPLVLHTDDEEEKKDGTSPTLSTTTTNPASQNIHDGHHPSILRHWNTNANLAKLFHRRPATASLDGLRVASILWIILGHSMAIQSSSGGGYSNPADFLPPHGLTTQFMGQLLFSSRFAVDTFLLISGYLVVQVLTRLPRGTVYNSRFEFFYRYVMTLPKLLTGRLLRILPLYVMLLGVWVCVAPHLGGGPFWHQWDALLQPCRDYGWTNLLFVNNFFPLDLANTQTCFYHSWYLAVDVQLFVLAPLLVYLYQQHPKVGKATTLALMGTSMAVTCYLAYTRKWSLNTFDGAAVARFDVEGYAKPHVRAQSYLAGMGVALHLHSNPAYAGVGRYVSANVRMVLAMATLLVVAFVTVTGAYSRRPCRYEEWPGVCGSSWSPMGTFLYTGTSRALWSIAMAVIMTECLQGRGGWVGHFLSLPFWTPLSHLTFCVYLVHPIVIFVWQLGGRQKEAFRLLDFGMKYVAVTTVSFGFALVFCMMVEFPSANVVQNLLSRRRPPKTNSYERLLRDVEMEPTSVFGGKQNQSAYGSMNGNMTSSP
jgi:peptidoglycan/LPS O-acetylase OafA/YrhL